MLNIRFLSRAKSITYLRSGISYNRAGHSAGVEENGCLCHHGNSATEKEKE